MKKFLFLLVTSIALVTVTYASFPIVDNNITINEPCDNIILKNGEEISAKIIEITPDLIKYKRCENLDGPLISIYKDEVLMLKYQDGTKEIINNDRNKSRKNTDKSEVPISGMVSLTLSLIALLFPLPLFLAIFFSGIGFISGFAALGNEKYWGLGLAGMIIGLIDLVLLCFVLGVL